MGKADTRQRRMVAVVTQRLLLPDAALEPRIAALAGAGADLIQVREKDLGGAALLSLSRRLLAVVRSASGGRCRLLVNGRLDVALAAGACGIHLPARGLPVAAVRRLAPPGFLIGVSTHTPEEVRAAAAAGADHVFYGPVFASATHPGHPGAGRAGLQAALQAAGAMPLWAIGGIDADSVAGLDGLGLAGVAAIRALLMAADPGQAVRALSGDLTTRA